MWVERNWVERCGWRGCGDTTVGVAMRRERRGHARHESEELGGFYIFDTCS